MERRLVSAAVLAGLAILPASASAATTIGPDPLPAATALTGPGACCGTFVNAAHPTAALAAPAGVVTRWRAAEPMSATALTPRVLRPAVGGVFAGVATGAQVTAPTGSGPQTYATRLPIAAGDHFGVDGGAGPNTSLPGAAFQLYTAAIADGATGTSPSNEPDRVLAVNADVEPDADTDGFGDESQDLGGAAGAFAAVEVGRIGAATAVTFTNPGATPVTPQVKLDAGDFLIGADACSGTPVAPGGSCSVQVRFAPSATGTRSGQLTIRGAADPLGQVLAGSDVALRATGTPATRGPAGPAGRPGSGDDGEGAALVALLLRDRLSVRRGRTLRVSILSTLPGEATIRIRRGRRVAARAEAAVEPGRTRLRLPVRRLRPGRYAVVLEVTADEQTARDTARLRIRRR